LNKFQKNSKISLAKKAACLNIDWVLNRDACIGSCLSGDVTRSFRLHDIKLFNKIRRFLLNQDEFGSNCAVDKHTVVMVVLPEPFRGMGVRPNSRSPPPRSGPEVKNGRSNAKDKAHHWWRLVYQPIFKRSDISRSLIQPPTYVVVKSFLN